MKIKNAALFLMLFMAIGCMQEARSVDEIKNFDYGKVKQGVYINKFFNCKITVPKGWHIQNKEQIKAIIDKGKKIVEEKNTDKVVKSNEITTATLLMVFRDEIGTNTEYNPNFILLAENVSNVPGIINGKDYLAAIQNSGALTKNDSVNISSTTTEETINGWHFYQLSVHNKKVGLDIIQTYAVTVKKGFALCALYSYSYTNDSQKEQVEKMMHTFSDYKH